MNGFDPGLRDQVNTTAKADEQGKFFGRPLLKSLANQSFQDREKAFRRNKNVACAVFFPALCSAMEME